MKRVLTQEVQTHVGERVLVQGWLHSLRQLGGVNFLVVRDGWSLLQCVTEHEEEIAVLQNVGVSTRCSTPLLSQTVTQHDALFYA